MLCADMVTVCWENKRGKPQQVPGLLEDISTSGACLQLEMPVPRGAVIHWESPKQKFTGRVQYCVFREIGFFVGVAFDSDIKWSKRTYKPQHLLDLQRLIVNAKR